MSVSVGSIYPTKRDGNVQVIARVDRKHVRVRFIEHPFETDVRLDSLRNGHVKNYMRPVVCGVGFVGSGPWPTSVGGQTTTTYKTWNGMLTRCYAPRHENHIRNWSDVTVHPEWINFQNFATWYEERLDKHGPVDFKWELDKDMLVPGNRQYGPSVCCLLPQPINGLFNDHGLKRGNLPLGITKMRKQYQARVNAFGVCRELGCYSNLADAQRAYWSEKFRVIQETTIRYWQYLPEPLAWRLLTFDWPDAHAYYGDDAAIRL